MSPGRVLPLDLPFMNNMDEISYWVHTKRAPCLMNYDNFVPNSAPARSSRTKTRSVHSTELPPPRARKKRKLSILDNASASTEKQNNIYFQVPQKQFQKTNESSSKSESTGSDVDFNIKNSSIQQKQKRSRHHKNSRTTLHKKNKIVTSTPKTASNLRRSLRRAQRGTPNNSQLHSSFEIFSTDINNSNTKSKPPEVKCSEKLKKSAEALAGGDQDVDSKEDIPLNNIKKDVLNGEFEDMSDVSGFTANYIRSTKLTRSSRQLRGKSSRNLIKERRDKDKTIVCVNKAVNTGLPKSSALNCSTDSSQNIVSLVTRSSDRLTKVNKSTSLLKFIDAKPTKSKEGVSKVDASVEKSKTTNASFQSSRMSRYPKRYQNNSTVVSTHADSQASEKKRKISKHSNEFNDSDRKENPEECVSKTRSGRNIGLTLRQPDNSVLVLSNSTEQVSSMASMNVATPIQGDKIKKKRHNSRYVNAKKSIDKTGSLRKDSLREKSGFTACFTDSEDDNEPLKQRKFFRA